MNKLWKTLSVINVNTTIGNVRKQTAECCSSPGSNVDSLSTVSRSYWELLGCMANLFFHFHTFLDTSKVLLMVALVLLEAIGVTLVPTT